MKPFLDAAGWVGGKAREHLWDNRSGSFRTYFTMGVATPILAAMPYIYFTYHYSEGFREGQITKLSRKGFLCKTWEGELAMRNFSHGGSLNQPKNGVDNTFAFSITDPSVAKKLDDSSGAEVKLTYDQYLSPLSTWPLCSRRTEYVVTDVKTIAAPSTYTPKLEPLAP
jgi:hypothetical protein